MASVLAMVSAIVLLITCMLVCAHIIMRGFFNSGFVGIHEIVQMAMLLVVSFTLAENELSGGTVVVNVLLDKMKPRTANVLSVAMYILAAAGMAYVLYNQMQMVIRQHVIGAITGVLHVPQWILVAIICIGLFFFIIAFIVKIHNMIENHKNLQETKLTKDQIAAETIARGEF